MEGLRVLNDFCAKKKLSKDDQKKAVAILLEMSDDINNAKQVVGYLMKLHYSACSTYYARAAAELSDEKLVAIVEAFRSNDQIKSNQYQNFLFPKGFGSVLSLARAAKYELAFSILNDILLRSKDGSQFTDGCKDSFKRIVIDAGGFSHIQKLFEVVSLDDFKANLSDKRGFERFLGSFADFSPSPASLIVREPKTVKEERSPDPIKKERRPNDGEGYVSVESLVKVESTQSEILTVLRNLTENRTAIDILALQIQKKDDEIVSAQARIRDLEQQLSTTYLELKKSKEDLLSAEMEISDLTSRLRTSLSMDEISKNQELTTLKKDISEALRLDYVDFMETKNSDCSQDLFEAYRSMIMRIFKLLNRFGISQPLK